MRLNGIHSQRDETPVSLSVRVFDCHGNRITQRLFRVGEAYPVLASF